MNTPRKFFGRPANLLALLIISAFFLVAAAAPILAPPDDPDVFSPYKNVAALKGTLPQPPGRHAFFGTIATGILGRQLDVYYTVVWGTRSALRFGLLVTLTTALLGVIVGAVSAYLGGWLSQIILRITDAFLAFPLIAGVVIFQQLAAVGAGTSMTTIRLTGSNSLEPTWFQRFLLQVDPVMLAFILFLWMPYARLTYTMVLQLKGAEFIEAARSLGAGSIRILLRHLLPNSISPALVLAARDIGLVVILQASLTFIGIVNDSEWGTLLTAGRRWIIGLGGYPLTYWWTFLPATLTLILFGVGWNLLGDGLNDWNNPRNEL